MDMAVQYEKFLNEFFLNVKDLTRHLLSNDEMKKIDKWKLLEMNLQKKFDEIKLSVHTALCDNIDTRTVLDVLRDLVTTVNIYIRDNAAHGYNALLLRKIAEYVTDILHIFGAIKGPRGGIGFPIRGIEGFDVSFFFIYITIVNFRTKIFVCFIIYLD